MSSQKITTEDRITMIIVAIIGVVIISAVNVIIFGIL
jgi:hypothetical protein